MKHKFEEINFAWLPLLEFFICVSSVLICG